MSRFHISTSVKKELGIRSGHKCSFPGCGQNLFVDDEAYIGHVAVIEALVPNGPRHNPYIDVPDISLDNLILLCPGHHLMIDKRPEAYSTEWLKKARDEHFERISKILEADNTKLDEQVEVSLIKAVKIWESEAKNPSEEFWQTLFQKCPSVLSQLFPRTMLQLGAKCYVGGKTITNKGGNIVDFIYANKHTGNVALIEIKTPVTTLLGKQYRANSYSMSDDLTGSLVQVLNYKDQLLKEFYKLCDGAEAAFTAFNPKCAIICGSIEDELIDPIKTKSFELFRNGFHDVEIITYDEVLSKTKDIIDMINTA